jgi:hypothetical protein
VDIGFVERIWIHRYRLPIVIEGYYQCFRITVVPHTAFATSIRDFAIRLSTAIRVSTHVIEGTLVPTLRRVCNAARAALFVGDINAARAALFVGDIILRAHHASTIWGNSVLHVNNGAAIASFVAQQVCEGLVTIEAFIRK